MLVVVAMVVVVIVAAAPGIVVQYSPWKLSFAYRETVDLLRNVTEDREQSLLTKYKQVSYDEISYKISYKYI